MKVRWTPYWFASNACVEAHGDWTKVIAEEVDSCASRRASRPSACSSAAAAAMTESPATRARPGRARLISLAALRTHPIYRQLVRSGA